MRWNAGTENSSDLYTKNLMRKEFEKLARAYVDHDIYMEHCHKGRVSEVM